MVINVDSVFLNPNMTSANIYHRYSVYFVAPDELLPLAAPVLLSENVRTDT